MVCVDYSDLLEVTLPLNRHHFDNVTIVTSSKDVKTQELCHQEKCDLYVTDSFYDNGAQFNKWKALEEGLDAIGRLGWLCVMDADVLWPQIVPDFNQVIGNLYTPMRRMFTDLSIPLPEEKDWHRYKIHPNINEWAGYSQIFHADDPHLPLYGAPYHDTSWKHAGGADSFFQMRWPCENKIRPDFEVLHLGEAGRNWCGRVTNYLDGTTDPSSQERSRQLNDYLKRRNTLRNTPNRFEGEKIL